MPAKDNAFPEDENDITLNFPENLESALGSWIQ